MTTEQFLAIFKDSYLQTFDDSGQERQELIVKEPVSHFSSPYTHLEKLNKAGAGIFVTPNPCSGGRKAEHISALKWAFVDMDNGTKEDMYTKILNSPIRPSLITESKRSYHLYFRSDITLGNWDKIIGGLLQYFDGDEAVASTNEVLRVPGFFHMKDAENPFMIRVEEVNSVKYTEEELMTAFPFESFTQKFTRQHGSDETLDRVKALDIRDVLRKLGADVRGIKVFEDGKSTSMTVNVQENYLNRFSGKSGSGSTIDVVMNYKNCTTAEAIRWLKQEYHISDHKRSKPVAPVVLPGAIIRPSDLREELIDDMRKGVPSPYTWGTDQTDFIFPPIERGDYIVLGGETGVGKTTFALAMAIQNATKGSRVLFLSLEMANKALMRQYARKRSGGTKEEQRLGQHPEHKIQLADKAIAEIPETFLLYNFPQDAEYNMGTFRALNLQYGPFDMIFIDNLGFVKGDGEQITEKQSSASRDIVNFCKEFSETTAVVALHHFKKGNDGKPRRLDDLMGSAKVGHDVSYALQVWRYMEKDIPDAERSKLILMLQKSRNWGDYEQNTIHHYQGGFYDTDQRLNRPTWLTPAEPVSLEKPQVYTDFESLPDAEGITADQFRKEFPKSIF